MSSSVIFVGAIIVISLGSEKRAIHFLRKIEFAECNCRGVANHGENHRSDPRVMPGLPARGVSHSGECGNRLLAGVDVAGCLIIGGADEKSQRIIGFASDAR